MDKEIEQFCVDFGLEYEDVESMVLMCLKIREDEIVEGIEKFYTNMRKKKLDGIDLEVIISLIKKTK